MEEKREMRLMGREETSKRERDRCDGGKKGDEVYR